MYLCDRDDERETVMVGRETKVRMRATRTVVFVLVTDLVVGGMGSGLS